MNPCRNLSSTDRPSPERGMTSKLAKMTIFEIRLLLHDDIENRQTLGLAPKAANLILSPGWPRCGNELVEPVGIEPTTPCLQSRCSPS